MDSASTAHPSSAIKSTEDVKPALDRLAPGVGLRMMATGPASGTGTMGASTLHGMNPMGNHPLGETAGASVVTSPTMPALAAAPAPVTSSAASAPASTESKSKDNKSAKAEGTSTTPGAEEKKKSKRCMFQKEVVKTLKHWLSQNFENPYPTEEEKKTLAMHTGLSQLQVNNWFINARRRLVQPLVEKYNKDHPGATPLPNVQEAQKHRRRRQVSRDPSLQSPQAKMGKFDSLGHGQHVTMSGMPGGPQLQSHGHMQQGHGHMPVAQTGIAMPSSSQSVAAMNPFNPQLLTMQPAIFAGQPPAGAMNMNVPQTAFWDPAHSYLQPTMSFLPSGAATIDTTMGQMIPTYAHGWNTMAATNYGGSKPTK